MKYSRGFIQQVQELMVSELEAQMEGHPEPKIDDIELRLRQMLTTAMSMPISTITEAEFPTGSRLNLSTMD